MFLSREVLLGVVAQMAELQWAVYQNFLKMTGSEEEATKQTKIYMTAFLAAGRNSEGDTSSDGQYQ